MTTDRSDNCDCPSCHMSRWLRDDAPREVADIFTSTIPEIAEQPTYDLVQAAATAERFIAVGQAVIAMICAMMRTQGDNPAELFTFLPSAVKSEANLPLEVILAMVCRAASTKARALAGLAVPLVTAQAKTETNLH